MSADMAGFYECRIPVSTSVDCAASTNVYAVPMGLGANIRQRRQRLGLTLGQLSELSGVELGTISALENRDSSRSKYGLALAHALGVTLDQLSSGAEPATGPASARLGIGEALAILAGHLAHAEPSARKAAGSLLQAWAEAPDSNTGAARTLERILQPPADPVRVARQIKPAPPAQALKSTKRTS